jgi:DNA polymerase I-like protein with 3'-5' exonuclease and polymerase domains
MFIPLKIRALSPADAYKFYRDVLAWQVYPVYPPTSAKAKDPGKQPVFQKWWDYDPQDCAVDKYFRGDRNAPYNIGVAPRKGLIIIDLDSKPDQGKSVHAFLLTRPELAKPPRHITRGGVHLVLHCPDLPLWKKPNGGPCYDPVRSQLNQLVTAELFWSDHQNVVIPPSVHPISGFVYAWDQIGEVPSWPFAQLRQVFGFTEPDSAKPKPKRSGGGSAWAHQFEGDLTSLDLVKLLEHLGHPVTLLDSDTGKYAVKCPWQNEHTRKNNAGADTSTVLWKGAHKGWPRFKCSHAHCSGRNLKELLQWAQNKEPGCVDQYCSRQRVWQEGQRSPDDRPRVLHPDGRLESEVADEVGQIMGPTHTWFQRANLIVTVQQIPSGFIYSDDSEKKFTVEAYTAGFCELTAPESKTGLEYYIEPGKLHNDVNGEPEFIPQSFSTDFCATMLKSRQFKNHLPLITRVLTIPLPFRVDNKLAYPKAGYDPRFGTYLVPGAPEIKPMSLKTALRVLEKIHQDFCFTNAQSRTHAYARLITPAARGIMGWTTRVPFWFYCANRPRAGKDYLNGVATITYEGEAFEDMPIGRESEETKKRIMAAACNGRRFIHFANCQGYLQDEGLAQVLTAQKINGRRLGSNDAASDLSLPNEIEFSMSANVGLTYRPDFEERIRKIELAYHEEDPNSRVFRDRFLHETVRTHRGLVLSAISRIYQHWADEGFPGGETTFMSFPLWSQVVGGVMMAAGLGDPCLPFEGEFAIGGDLKTAAMTELFRVCYEQFGPAWVDKKKIYAAIHQAALDQPETEEAPAVEGNDALRWFGPLEDHQDAHNSKTKLGLYLHEFKNRILGGIQLAIDTSNNRVARHRYGFTRPESKGSLTGSGKTCDKTGLKTPESPGNSPISASEIGTRGTFCSLQTATALREEQHFRDEKCINIHEDIRKEYIDVTRDEPLYPANHAGPATFNSGFLALDIETFADPKVARRGRPPKISASSDALHPWTGEIRLLTLGDEAGNIQCFDLLENPIPSQIKAALGGCPLIIHHAAFDLSFLSAKLGVVPPSVFCTLTASRLLEPDRKISHSLGSALNRHLGVQLPKEHGGSDWGALVLTDEQLAYAADDVRHLHRLREELSVRLDKAGLTKVFEHESELIAVVVAMEQHGFAVDAARMKVMALEAETLQALLNSVLKEKFGNLTLNPDSSDQVLEAFKSSGVQIENTSEETLCGLTHECAPLVLKFREAAKLGGSIRGLLKHVRRDGRIHARFNPLGSCAGRFSSKDPNLQNVTRGPLRSCFVPGAAERKLIVADYSQIELRIAAYFANDRVMLAAFQAKEDLHRKTAAAVLNKVIDGVTKEDRQLAKAVNFGFVYGQGPEGFQRYALAQYGIVLSLEEATQLRNKFFTKYVGLAAWHQQAWRKAEAKKNEGRTVLGRRLIGQGARNWDRFQVHTNYTVQGSAADVMKAAMVKVAQVLPSEVHLVATVHDELVLDCHHRSAEQTSSVVRMAMEEAFNELFPGLPIEVEAKVCSNWGEK